MPVWKFEGARSPKRLGLKSKIEVRPIRQPHTPAIAEPTRSQIERIGPKKKKKWLSSLRSSGSTAVEITTANTNAALNVLQMATSIAEHVPYVNGIVGVLKELIQVRQVSKTLYRVNFWILCLHITLQDIQAKDKRCQEVIDRVLRLTGKISVEMEKKFSESSQKEHLASLQGELHELKK